MKFRILITITGLFIFNITSGQEQVNKSSMLNDELIVILDTIYENDQKYREQSILIEKEFGKSISGIQ